MNRILKNRKVTAVIVLIVISVIMALLTVEFKKMFIEDPIYVTDAVTEIKMLSDYLPQLKDTPGDTEIYIMRGEQDGASMLVIGGTHPREPAGALTAITLIENASAQVGTLYILPRANESAYTATEPMEGTPTGYTIQTPTGPRYFKNAGRMTNPLHQWPDPDLYHHNTGQILTGKELRNLNRVYPGKADGTLTEQIAAAIVAFINAEDIDVTIDLHEGPPEFLSLNALIVHERAMDLTTEAVFNLAFEGVEMDVQASPKGLHGYSHRELGDYTNTMPALPETCNIEQGRLPGKKTEDTLLTSQSKFYAQAAEKGLYNRYKPEGVTIDERVARHLETVRQYAVAYNTLGYEGTMEFTIPSYNEVLTNGVGYYLGVK